MTNNYPLVSIIIPTYNSSDYIIDTLRKLESQSYKNFEIIVVNDGSKDNTLELLKAEEIINPRLKVIDKTNGGVSSARNSGIRNAQGRFISFLDDDDEFDPDYLIKMYARYRETGAKAIYCGFYGYSTKNGITYSAMNSAFNEGALLMDFLNKRVRFHIGCLFLSKRFVEENYLYFDETLHLGEDLHYIYNLIISCYIYAVPYYLYTHVYRENSLMNSKRSLEHYQHETYAHEKIYSLIMDRYQGTDKEEVGKILNLNMFRHKIRYMWKILLLGKFDLLEQSVISNYSELKSYNNLMILEGKYKRKARVLASGNKLLWKCVRLINKNTK